jgi:hypothetical protein
MVNGMFDDSPRIRRRFAEMSPQLTKAVGNFVHF